MTPANRLTTNLAWAQMIARVTADACGLDHEQLFAEAGVALDKWQPESRITQADITALWEAADRLTGRPDIGLGVLEHFHFQTLGPVAFKMLAARTFGQSIEEIFQHIPLVSETWNFELCRQGRRGMVKYRLADPRARVTHHSYDAFASACVRLLRDAFPGKLFRLEEIWLAHSDFGCVSNYEQRLGCHCRFHAPCYALCFSADLLDMPLPSADPELYQSLDTRLDQQTQSRQGLSTVIEKAILALIDQGLPPSRESVARRLGLGERTLLRRLKAESRTYKAIQEAVCERLARQWLKHGDSAEFVAERLGYADAASLGKMLRRRTGKGLRELRQ